MDAQQITIKTSLVGLAIAACFATNANATIIYNTPGTSVINTAVNDNVLIDSASAVVNVTSGGVVQGVSPSLSAVRVQKGTLDISGTGRIFAAAGQESAINALGEGSVVRLREQGSVTGNIEQHSHLPGWENEATARNRLYIQDQAVVNGDLRYSGYFRMQDDAVINGSIRSPSAGNLRLDMLDGTVNGELNMSGYVNFIINLSGGSILGGMRGNSGIVDLNMTGGYIGQGIRTYSAISGVISGGDVDGGILIDTTFGNSSHLSITGGEFDTVAGDYLVSMSNRYYTVRSSLDISGGQWGYDEAGLGLYFNNFADFSITGWDLTFVGGLLSGYLLDGSWFSNQLTFGSDWRGTFTINNVTTPSVPEPGTLGLLIASVAGMMFARRPARNIGSA